MDNVTKEQLLFLRHIFSTDEIVKLVAGMKPIEVESLVDRLRTFRTMPLITLAEES